MLSKTDFTKYNWFLSEMFVYNERYKGQFKLYFSWNLVIFKISKGWSKVTLFHQVMILNDKKVNMLLLIELLPSPVLYLIAQKEHCEVVSHMMIYQLHAAWYKVLCSYELTVK